MLMMHQKSKSHQKCAPGVPPLDVPDEIIWVGEDDSSFFRIIHGRKLNALNKRYMLPADADEIRVSEQAV